MPDNQWKKYEQAYHLRSLKYAKGGKLKFSRKHEGLAEYLNEAAEKIGRTDFSFLDAGCGNGIYLKYMGDKYPEARLHGFDFSQTIVDIAKNNAPTAEIKSGNLEAAPYADEKFDIILCTQVIEHLLDDKKGLTELYRLLKPNGYLIISTDNEDNLVSKFLNLPIKLLSSPYRLLKRLLPDKKYFPHKSYKIGEFTKLIKTRALIIEKISTFRFSLPWPFYKMGLLNQLLNKLETFAGNKNFFRNNGDIVVALCKK
ncbi:MAG: class I SAM-dependent methyltransferase [Patescibacteria group bacterium]